MSVTEYFTQGGVVGFIVTATLSLYFISSLAIFIYRYKAINRRLKIEQEALSELYTSNNNTPDSSSILYGYMNRSDGSLDKIFKAAINDTIRVSSRGLTQLSLMATTSPFIGLFGTVIGILNAFGRLGNVKSASLAVVAPAISEALVATAAGIFVAIFAYSFNLLLKRKVYELNSTLESSAEIIVSRNE